MSVSIGRYAPQEMGKPPREHIQIHNDPEGFVSRNHGDISFEKGRIFYTDHSTNGTSISDANGNVLREIKNEKVEIDPSWKIVLPNGSAISFAVERLEMKVTEPPVKEEARPNEQRQAYETTWERMKERAGARSANSLVSFISHSIDLREKQMGAGVRMGIDHNLNKIKSGRWDEGYVVHLPKEGQVIIIGDIHSKFDCLDHIMEETNFVERVKNGEKLYLVFMGDLVDRPRVVGDGGGLKVFEAALSLLNSFPNNVIIEKGNHDGAAEGSLHPQEFYQEVRIKFGEKQAEFVLKKWREFYDKAPIAVKMENGGIAIHGGASSTVKSLADLVKPSEETKFEIAWNDPNKNAKGYVDSSRGDGVYTYGEREHRNFVEATGSLMVFRGHEQDIRADFNGTCLTINSTDYKDAPKGYAIVDLSKDLKGYQVADLSDLISGKANITPSIMIMTF
ncbi:metallophosphoesterase, partial [Candidatus Micrarchaeota archaeon]|nr:metallophosphoesterase [Candidatus Micrarchaeota archaeon]